ncbi:MAG: DegV family protein [Clostridia bacterium]|nr:DegV family protein [Clostridia bacterium]
MADNFIISCESTTDLPYKYFKKNKIPVLFYRYVIDGNEYEDNMGRDKKNLKDFYSALDNGAIPKTSQINEFSYNEFFRNLLKENKPILHISFGSGMTPSVNNAVKAANEINRELGKELITVVDSTCSSAGYGLIFSMAFDYAKLGKDIQEVKEYLESTKKKIHHQFFSTDMKYFKRSGRVSGAAATVGAILGICPIMRLNSEGKIVAYNKARGRKRAIEKTLEEMIKHAENGKDYNGKCFINHSNCYDYALALKKEAEQKIPKLKGKIEIYDIGNIIASHCGPGTVAVYFVGDERE